MKKRLSYTQLLKNNREEINKDKEEMKRIDEKIERRHTTEILKPRFA
ncbi:FbpB family small basic protein [Sporolactobacillus pectinivorans]|nr:FbpB family small basic protein [Sporolactobacillus pectinivorans]